MNIEVIISILTFTVVMVIFNLIKDYLVKSYYDNITQEHLDKANKRWWYAYIIGCIILFLAYSRAGP